MVGAIDADAVAAGHADIQTTQKFYLSVQDEDMEKARSVQQKLVSGISDIIDNAAVTPTDHFLTIRVENRSFPKRRIFEDGTQLDEEKE